MSNQNDSTWTEINETNTNMTSRVEPANNDLGLRDAHATGSCDCPEGECKCGHHQTCDCAPNECKCQHGEGAGEHNCAHCDCPEGECKCDHHYSCGCPEGECKCGHHEHRNEASHAECGCSDKDSADFSDPDAVRADGTNPAVKTVNEADSHQEGTGWNDGIAPGESANPQSYEADDKNVN